MDLEKKIHFLSIFLLQMTLNYFCVVSYEWGPTQAFYVWITSRGKYAEAEDSDSKVEVDWNVKIP